MTRPPMDWRDNAVARTQAMRDLDAYAWDRRPLINWRALGWCCVTVLICAFLLGLMAVGK